MFLDYKILFELFGFEVHTYAICILLGAFTCYFLCQWLAKKNGYPKHIIYDAFLFVFPMGLIGARLWYVIANFYEFTSFWQIFKIWEGGLAVQGGVALGVASGIWYFRKKHPKENIRFWADIVIPNILIAQVIGRWGNFFNNELYGACVDIKPFWSWMPNFMIQQLGSVCTTNNTISQIALPLFLIEGTINFIGFILIGFVLRFKWKKGRIEGDLAALYFIWYGIVRMILEPLRDPAYIMSFVENGISSTMLFSGLMVIGGILFMIVSRKIKPKNTKEYEYADILDKMEEK